MELYSLSAIEIAKKIRKKEISAKEVVEASIKRISSVEEKVEAFITQTLEDALLTAEIVDKKIAGNIPISPLSGIPLGVKDNISTKGVRTTAASKILENYIPPFDATVIEIIKKQDMPILGKLNLDEFAMGSTTETSYFHKTRNPHNLSKVPGGSSGGSAAAVASGEVTLALGSDTGGSIRQPASFTGTVGLKPTYGSISRRGLIAYASSFDQISPIGRTVKDVALLFENIMGQDKKDSTTFLKKIDSYIETSKSANVNGLKIGVPKEFFSSGVDSEIKNIVYNEIERLKEYGAEIKEVSIPSVKYSLATYYIIATAQASSNLGRIDGVGFGYRTNDYNNLEEMYEKSRGEGFGREVKKRIMLGTFFLSGENKERYYNQAILMKNLMIKEFSEIFKTVDLLITPTTPTTAYDFGRKNTNQTEIYAGDILTTTANITGLPALSLPCGSDLGNLPIGMQLISNYNREDIIFNTGNFYENLVGGFTDVPKI